ncbi:hypothetical protein IP93_00695 [Lysobacter ruishenii]|uniref:Uncharacterized protein n=1 Tax=Aerolutibacter ruishenii TaxID=686800 RepID=A0A562M103_9GAMM|nr:hypothetical protein IP93_00695 [Lysobacter ruishenii]
MRRAAFFAAVSEASERHSLRAGPRSGLKDAWLSLRLDRREVYLSGRARPGERMLERLLAEFPRAVEVWNSRVWECLDLDRTTGWLSTQLFVLTGKSRATTQELQLLGELAAGAIALEGGALDRIAVHLVAFRCARGREQPELAAHLAMRLARCLLMLSACPYRRTAAERIWDYADSHFFRGFKYQGRAISLKPQTWDFVGNHARGVLAACRGMAFMNPLQHDLPDSVADFMLREFVDGIATLDPFETERLLSRYRSMSPDQKARDRLPDPDRVGLFST